METLTLGPYDVVANLVTLTVAAGEGHARARSLRSPQDSASHRR